MPLNLLRVIKSNINLDTFFGFAECIVECPTNIKIPILPVKHNGKTIFPTGKWQATYFSEEIKEAVKLGYKIKLLVVAMQMNILNIIYLMIM